MAPPLLLSLRDAFVTFGGKPLFDGLSVNLHAGEKICLVGKNGAGKTTLMKLITNEKELDGGERWEEIGLTIGYLRQEVEPIEGETVRGYVATGLEKDKQNEAFEYLVDKVLEPFGLRKDQLMTQLSGGQLRRAALARSLIEDPDILLLDEPTNHLDLGAIEWLENYLKGFRGTVLCISHDRTFLANMSNKVFWLDRGKVRVCPKGFGHFEEWSQMLLEQEERELRNREKIVAQEVEWASKGISARRKRNVRRVALMRDARDQLRSDKYDYRQATKKMELPPLEPAQSSRVVCEFYKAKKKFTHDDGHETIILDGFSMRLMRGDRIGILGRNGCGKTSFLKLLLKEDEPDSGSIKLAKHLDVSYFDQRREMLNPNETIRRTLCPGGGEYVNVGGKMRHVCGYLKDFMFDPKSVDDKVGTLSGGQRNRLMLAYVLANPGNLLILDEPTNDLDMDTLDILEEILCNYTGTLICVSHDRDFLDQTVTRLMAFEGDGHIESVVGGYEDYLRAVGRAPQKKAAKAKPAEAKQEEPTPTEKPKAQKKLSYKLQYELDGLPARMEQLEAKKAELEALMADSTLYSRDPEAFDKATRSFARVREELEQAEARWLELEEMRMEMDAAG